MGAVPRPAADLAECTIPPVSATTLAAPRGIPGPSLPATLSGFLSAGNACDFVIAMTKRDHYLYGLGQRYCIGAGYSQVAMPLLLERFLESLRVELVAAVPRISHSLPLSLRSTRVRLTARP